MRLEQKIFRLDTKKDDENERQTDLNIELTKLDVEMENIIKEKKHLDKKINNINNFKVDLDFNKNDIVDSLQLYNVSLKPKHMKNESNLLFETISEIRSSDLDGLDDSLLKNDKNISPIEDHIVKSDVLEITPQQLKNSCSFLKTHSVNNFKANLDIRTQPESPKHNQSLTNRLKFDNFRNGNKKNHMSIGNLYKKTNQKPINMMTSDINRISEITSERPKPFYLTTNELETTVVYKGINNKGSYRKTQEEPKLQFKKRSLSNIRMQTAFITGQNIETEDLKSLLENLVIDNTNINTLMFRKCHFACDFMKIFLKFFNETRKSAFFIDLRDNRIDHSKKEFRNGVQRLYSRKIKILI